MERLQVSARAVTSKRGARRAIPLGLGVLILVFVLGAVFPGAKNWGWNFLSYLPRSVFAVWILCAVLVLVLAIAGPRWERRSGRFWSALVRFLFETGLGPWIAGFLGLAGFFLLRSRSFYFGDGPLLGELTEKGIPFHGFDDMHYALHAWIYRVLLPRWDISSNAPFQVGSVLAGGVGVVLTLLLARRLSSEPWRKLLLTAWILGTGPVALFFGYVEVYSFLYAFLTAFLLAGLLALEGRAPLWWSGVLFALAVFFQMTAVFSAPALLYLFLRGPGSSWKRRAAVLFGPSLLPALLWVMIHLVLGLDAGWFRRGFLENEHARAILLPLTGSHGLLSSAHWRDMLNLALVTAPVPLMILLLNFRSLRERRGEPAVQFLLWQTIVWVLLNIFLDRKLGVARDWDLLAAHAGGLILLSAFLWREGAVAPRTDAGARADGRLEVDSRSDVDGRATMDGRAEEARPWPLGVTAALLGSLLLTLPWVLLIHWDRDSARWLADAAVAFGDPAQPYVYEELGKHYRLQGDYAGAEEMYRKCVQSGPDNPRFRILLGTTYAMRGKIDQAKEEYAAARAGYEAALKANPDDLSAKRRLAQILSWQGEHARATDLYLELTRTEPANASLWESLGRSALAADRCDLAAQALGSALRINPHLALQHELGVAWMGMGRYAEAAAAFRRALCLGQDPSTRLGLAVALVSGAEAELRAGRAVPTADLDEAEGELRRLGEAGPEDPDFREMLRRVQLLRHGVDPEAAR